MANWSPDRQQAVQARCEDWLGDHAHTPRPEDHTICLICELRRDGRDTLAELAAVKQAADDFAAGEISAGKLAELLNCSDKHSFKLRAHAFDEPVVEAISAKDAEIAKLTTRADEGHAAHAASFAALLKIAVVVQDGEVDSYDSLADKTIALLAHQQADLTRLAEVEEKARRVFEFGCSCGDVFDSLEAHAEHVALVHTGPDAKE